MSSWSLVDRPLVSGTAADTMLTLMLLLLVRGLLCAGAAAPPALAALPPPPVVFLRGSASQPAGHVTAHAVSLGRG